MAHDRYRVLGSTEEMLGREENCVSLGKERGSSEKHGDKALKEERRLEPVGHWGEPDGFSWPQVAKVRPRRPLVDSKGMTLSLVKSQLRLGHCPSQKDRVSGGGCKPALLESQLWLG